jgi:hypothetical protein
MLFRDHFPVERPKIYKGKHILFPKQKKKVKICCTVLLIKITCIILYAQFRFSTQNLSSSW